MCVTISWSEWGWLPPLAAGEDKPEVRISGGVLKRQPPNRIGRNQDLASEAKLNNVSFMPWVIKVRDDGDKEREQVGRIKNFPPGPSEKRGIEN